MPVNERLGVVLRRAATLLPGDLGRRVLALLSPQAIATMATVVIIWAGSHFVGVGEVADVLLLLTGWLAIGSGAVEGTKKLVAFAITTRSARHAADLDRAAHELADALTILGVDVALALLFRGRPRQTFHETHGTMPTYGQFAQAMPRAGPTAMYEARLIFTRGRFAGQGGTRPDNLATVGRNFYPEARSLADAVRDVRKTAYHERVHQRLTQAFSLLGRPALYAKMGAYKRSVILRYIEEAAAEAYCLRRVGGPRPGELTGLQFPLNGNYGITLAKMGTEARGILLGPVTVGGAVFHAFYGLVRP